MSDYPRREDRARTVMALWKNAELAKSYRYHPTSSRRSASGSFAGVMATTRDELCREVNNNGLIDGG